MLELRADGHHDIWTIWANIYVPQMSTVNVNLYYAATLRICQHMNICISKKKKNKVKIQNQKNRTNIFSARAFGACFVLGLKSEPGLSDRPTQIGLSSTDPKIWEPGITSIYNIIFALFDVGVVDLLASPLVLPCPVQSKPNQSNSFRSFVRLSFAFNLLFGLNKQQLRGKLF